MPCTGHVFSRSFGQLVPTVPIPYMESYILYTSCVFQVLWPAGTHCTNSIYGVLYPVHVMCFLQVLWPAGTHCTNSIYGVLYPVHVMCFLQVLWPAGTHCTNSIYGVLYPVHVMCFPGPLASWYPLYQFHIWSLISCTRHVFSRSFGQLPDNKNHSSKGCSTGLCNGGVGDASHAFPAIHSSTLHQLWSALR